MFPIKVSKREKIINKEILKEYFHVRREDNEWDEDYIQIGSFDPGTRNFGIRIERRYIKGENKDKIESILFERIEPLHSHELLCREDEGYKLKHYSVSKFLDNHYDDFKMCHVFIIEKQMPFNYQSTRMMQHVISYIALKFEHSPLKPDLIEISPTSKGRRLGFPGGDKNSLKRWSAEKAMELLEHRGDKEGLQKLRSATKKDDLADTICQIEAYCMIAGYPLTKKTVVRNIITDL